MKRSLLAAAALLLMATTANAASELRILQTSGYWTTFYTPSHDGTPICGMRSQFGHRGVVEGKLMIKYIKGQRRLLVHVFKNSWRIPTGVDVPIYLTFDNGPQLPAKGIGGSNGQHNFVEFEIAEDFTKPFFKMFRAAGSMTLGFREGSELPWTTPMTGSDAAAVSFARCIVSTGSPHGGNSATQPHGRSSAQPSQPFSKPPFDPTQPYEVVPDVAPRGQIKRDNGSI